MSATSTPNGQTSGGACPNNVWNHTNGCVCVPDPALQQVSASPFPTSVEDFEGDGEFSDESLYDLGGEAARSSYNRLAHKPLGTDADDIAQEVRIALLEAKTKGRLPDEWTSVREYAHGIARKITADQRWAGELRPEDRRAIGILRRWADQSEQHLGRSLKPQEWLDGYDRVMTDWHDPRRKPTAAFKRFAANNGVLASRETSLDGMAESYGGYDRIDEVAAALPPVDDHAGASSWVDKTNVMLDVSGKTAAAARRRMMWNVVAEHSNLPYARPGLLPDKQAFRHRAALKSDADVTAAADAYWDGEASPRVEALFAPYEPNGPDDEIRRKVADAFLNNPMARANAHDLWDGALMFSSNRYAEESRKVWAA